MCQGFGQGQSSPQSFGQPQSSQVFAPRMMAPYAPKGGWQNFGQSQGSPQQPPMQPQAQPQQFPQNSIAPMFGSEAGKAQSFFDSIRKYAPGQQQAPQTPNPAFNPQGPDPQQKGIIITEDGQPQYSPAPWTPASTPNYLHPPTAAYMYGADPWQRTDPRQVWSGDANGRWGLQPGYNGYTG